MNSNSDYKRALDALVDVVQSFRYSKETRGEALGALVKAGAVEQLARIAANYSRTEILDRGLEWTRESAIEGLVEAGAVNPLVELAGNSNISRSSRQKAASGLSKLVANGDEVELTEVDVEGVLRVHARTTRLKVR